MEPTRKGVVMLTFEREYETLRDGSLSFAVKSFRGKGKKHIKYYSFRDKESAEKWIAEVDANEQALDKSKRDEKAAREAAKGAFVNPFEVGSVLYNSWGYDQTNVDWYEVVRVSKRSIWVTGIAKDVEETGFMCGRSRPVPGAWLGLNTRCKTLRVNPDGSYSIPVRHGSMTAYDASRTDGVYCSWYA
jgi:hypothetical protein|tara:strand:- start:13376 stop:13939 length:564 start_codon:yes stop_codon:yes gene_type:complete